MKRPKYTYTIHIIRFNRDSYDLIMDGDLIDTYIGVRGGMDRVVRCVKLALDLANGDSVGDKVGYNALYTIDIYERTIT
jgi:hypothetical protein